MTRTERIKQELAKLEAKQRELAMRGKLIEARQMQASIDAKRLAVEECEYYDYVPLKDVVGKDELMKNKVYSKLLEIALAADYLSDCAIECKSILAKLGVGKLKLMDDIEIIRKYANKLSGMPCDKQFGELFEFMMDNDTLIANIHTLSRRYIREKLKAPEYVV